MNDILIEFPNLIALMQAFADQFENNYKLDLQEKKASGSLIESIHTSIQVNKNIFEVSVSLNDYWIYVEYGRRQGDKFPPIDAIQRWIQEKNIVPTADANNRIPTEKSLAFLIARSIAQNGIAPSNAFNRTFDNVLSDFKEALEIALMDDINGWLKSLYGSENYSRTTEIKLI